MLTFLSGYKGSSDKHIGLFLRTMNESKISHKGILVQFSLLGPKKKTVYTKTTEISPTNWKSLKQGHGFPEFISHDLLLESFEYFTPENKLWFRISITNLSSRSVHQQNMPREEKFLSEYFFGKTCDIIVRTADNAELNVHKSVLMENSEVFKLIFTIEINKKIVDICDFNEATVTELLRFIYYKKVENIGPIINELFRMAVKYEIRGLVDRCVEEIERYLTRSSIFKMMQISETLKHHELMKVCAKFIKR